MSSQSELAERLQIVERLTEVFRAERVTYIGVTLMAFAMILASAVLLVVQKGASASEITLLGGSTGVLGISGSQILRMWSRSLAWIGGQNSDKSS